MSSPNIYPYFITLILIKKGDFFLTSFVRKRGKTWTYYFEPTINGQQRQISKGGFRTKSEAKSALAQAIIDYEERDFIGNDKTRLNAFFEDWMENTIRPAKARTTYLRYQSVYDKYIRGHVGSEYLTAITPIKVERMLCAARKTGISETTVQHIYVLLNTVMQRAEKLRLIKDNPCKYVDRPQRKKSNTEVLDTNDISEILRTLDTSKPGDYIFYAGFLFALETGCRRGEMCGLEWEDINLSDNLIHIKRSMTYVNGHVFVGSTKTDQSVRCVPISDTLAAILRSFKVWQAEQRLAAGPYRKHNVFDGMEYDFAFSWPDGGYVHPLWWTTHMPKIIKRAGIDKHIRWHDLRHTSATLLIQQGTDLKTVQVRLGHVDSTMVMQRYGHLTDTMSKRAVSAIEQTIYQDRKIQ